MVPPDELSPTLLARTKVSVRDRHAASRRIGRRKHLTRSGDHSIDGRIIVTRVVMTQQ
jgi:hypothetical protein